MNPDIFQSNIFSLALSWIFAIPLLLGIIGWTLSIFSKNEGVPWLFSAWLGVCILIFSPARYLLFLVVLSSSYMVQSFGALISSFLLALYIPIVYGILAFIGVGLPILAVSPIIKDKITPLRGILASIVLPIACIIASVIFFWVLPFAGMTVGWLKVKDVIRAGNGPAALVFNYFVAPITPVILPGFFDQTPQKDIDLLRCHLAAVYVSDKKIGYFIKNQYPDIYERATKEK
jgi:hypothetical protein